MPTKRLDRSTGWRPFRHACGAVGSVGLLARSAGHCMIILMAGLFAAAACRGRQGQITGEDSSRAFAAVSAEPIEAGLLGFSTYLGGSKYDSIRDVTTDSQGNVYVTGGTWIIKVTFTRPVERAEDFLSPRVLFKLRSWGDRKPPSTDLKTDLC